MNRERFPGLAGNWARLDGPAGTQMVDTAIDAMTDFMRSGKNANDGGAFAAAEATSATVVAAREAVGALFSTPPEGVVFGPSMTALTMRFARTVITPGDEVVCTRLDHDANVRPWYPRRRRRPLRRPGTWYARACPDAGSKQCSRSGPSGSASPPLPTPCGTIPDLAASPRPPVRSARACTSTRSMPRRTGRSTRPRSTCSPAARTSGSVPTSGCSCADPAFLETLRPDKLAPVHRRRPRPLRARNPPVRVAGRRDRAAAYLRELDWDAVRAYEEGLLTRALGGLGALDGVTLYGAASDRTSTLMFNVPARTSLEVATQLASREIAVWDGNYYAYELERHLGLAPDGAVRAGFVHYNDEADADRLV